VTGRILAMLAIVVPAHAWAWSQATTEEGHPLHWQSECVWYTLSSAGSDDVGDLDALRAAVRSGFEAWNVDGSAVRFADGGLSECERAGYRPGKPHANLVAWLDDEWPYGTGHGDPFAVTSVYYDTTTGEILDADVEFNGVDFTWSTGGEPGVADVWNTMAHEAGHVLGLDHSDVAEATMYGFSVPGDTAKRDLHDDDLAGIRSIYPAGTELGPCPPPPEAGALCMGGSGGCSCAVCADRDAASSRHCWLLALAIACVAFLRARQRRRRRS
jgi:hypothetical protein